MIRRQRRTLLRRDAPSTISERLPPGSSRLYTAYTLTRTSDPAAFMSRIHKGGRRYETPRAGRDRPAVRRSGVSDHGERRRREGEGGERPRRRNGGQRHGHGRPDLRPDDGPRRPECAETGRARGSRGEVLRVPRRDPGAEKGRKARKGQLHELPRRNGGPPEGQRQAAGDPRRS